MAPLAHGAPHSPTAPTVLLPKSSAPPGATRAASATNAATVTVDTLVCEYRANPLGVDAAAPRLGWIPHATQRGAAVSAYQIQVASSAAALASGGNLWDTGQVASTENANVRYGGTALTSCQQVFWQVRVWDTTGAVSNWSAPASWTMGVLRSSDWVGQWITAGRAAAGYHDNGANAATGTTKWVQVDLGSAQAITAVRLHPTNNPNLYLPAYGFPVRFKIQMSNDPSFASGVTTVTDQTGADYPNPGAAIAAFSTSGSARYVRVTPTTLFYAPNNNVIGSNYLFSLSQIEVIAGGANVALGRTVSAADTLERNSEWAQASLTDGIGLVGSRPVTQSDRFRTNFTVASGLTRAVVVVCGLGSSEMTLNGTKVGTDLLAPNWSNYNQSVYYSTYDVTSMLQTGANAAGIALGNSFYNCNGGRYTKVNCSYGPRRLIAQIRLEYSNGTVTTIGSNSTWKWVPGPATFSCIYGGEDVDGRLDEAGWDTAAFNSSAWLTPNVTTGPTGGVLRGLSLNSGPTHVTQTFNPVSSQVVATGATVYDFGQNAAQMPTITTHGPAGSSVTLTTAEYTNGDGTLAPIVSPVSMTYTLKGSGSETFTPKFFYMGYRFVQAQLKDPSGNVSGSSLPTLDAISSQAITSSPGNAGSFSTSNPLFNNIHQLIHWAQVNDLTNGVLTDCPTREKLGWQEVSHFNGPALRYENDMLTQYVKQEHDMLDGQAGNGEMNSVIPALGTSGDVSPEWGTSAVMVPWQQYLYSGDQTQLAANYASAKLYVSYLGSQVNPTGSYLLNYGLGDWYDLGPNDVGPSQDTPAGLTATCIYFQDATVLSQMAQALGNTADANTYSQLAANIRTAFNAQFLNSSTLTYGVGTFTSGPTAYGSQTSNAMPLALGMVDAANVPGVLQAIVNDVVSHGYVVTSGDVGYRYLVRALADNGRSDVLFAINSRTNSPGYGYIISTGATALTEAWTASPINSHSLDHCMLGQLMEWLYYDLAGIQYDPTGPGFKKIIIKPAMVGTMAAVNATYHSVRGDITSNWTNGASGLTMNVTVPAAATATVYVPAASASVVQESGGLASSAPGVQFVQMLNGNAVYTVAPGTYAFTSLAVPTAPAGLTATAGANGVQLAWSASFNATQYNVKRASTSGGPYTTLTSSFSGTSFSDATAAFGSTYYYVVTAVNSAAESVNSNEAGIALSTPAAPTGVVITPGDTVAQLSWTPLTGVSGYRIKRSTTSGGPYSTVVISSTPGSSYIDTGLTDGTTYYYTITAVVFGNEGAATSQISARPAASSSLVARTTGGVVSTNYDSSNTNENIPKVVDGSASTKWYENAASSGVWIQYQFAPGQAWVITRYQITSANDVPGRDPAAWQFQGSNDGVTWTTLDTQTGQVFANRAQTNTYNFTNSTAYSSYRLYITADFTANNGIQLAELAFLSSAADAGDKVAPVLTLPAPITVTATSNDTAMVSFNPTASDAVSGNVVVNSVPPSGSQFPVGTTNVQCSATDLAGNTATGSFTVTVNRAYAAPTGLNATAVSESQILLKWIDNSTGEAHYQLESSPTGTGNWLTQSASLAANSTSGMAAGLNASSTYDLRVKATGPAGNSLYGTITAATPAGVGDGIPGWWRYKYFGNGLSAAGAAAATADPDGDGMTNAQEYACGTDPTDPTSVLKITQIVANSGGWLINFPSVAGKTYRVDSAAALSSASWTTVQDQIAGTGGPVQISVPAGSGAAQQFYRVVVHP